MEMVQVWWVQLLYKPVSRPEATVQTNVGWHQDRQLWSTWEEGSELFTAWVAVSDVTEDACPMRFVRGFHNWGLLNQGDFLIRTTMPNGERSSHQTVQTGKKLPRYCPPAESVSTKNSRFTPVVQICQTALGAASPSTCAPNGPPFMTSLSI